MNKLDSTINTVIDKKDRKISNKPCSLCVKHNGI